MNKKLLVIGGSGELGHQILLNSKGWNVYATHYSNKLSLTNVRSFALDINDQDSVTELISGLQPDVVINCAVSDRSINKIDGEDCKRRAVIDGAINVAQAVNGIGGRAIFLSTDLVFDGKKGNYTESDVPNPIIPYGQYKAYMEDQLLALNFDLSIVRTSLIVTLEPMGHQVSWIVDSIKNNEKLNLFTDEFRSPILGEDLAKAVLELAKTRHRGLINISGSETLSRYDLGCIIAKYFRLGANLLKPVEAKQLSLNRPYNCALDSSNARNIINTNIRPISNIFI